LGRVTSAGLAEDRRTLAAMTSVEVTEHFGVRPRRARQLAAGAAIVEVLLDHFGLDEASVSDASLRDGAIIAASRFGDAWPERLTELLADPGQAVPTSSSH
jgi:exopolyphosphatase/pppGpp-phosphohydrolase